ncbi:hypothetical protein ACEPAG_2265 [Sanghuangporus baumii]
MATLNATNSFQIRSDPEPVDTSLIELFVSVTMTGKYFAVALLSVLVYHAFLTLDKEVKYFWPKSDLRSSASVAFFSNRFIGILGAACTVADILLLRVSALYHENKKLFAWLLLLLGLDGAIGLAILIYDNIYVGVAAGTLSEGMTVCGLDRASPRGLSIFSWTIPIAYGLILLGFALYKAAEYWRLSSGFKGLHLIRVLIEDQVMYFAFVIFCCVLRIIFLSIRTVNIYVSSVLGAIGSPTLLCVLGGQLLINLKEAGERGANGGANYTPESMSGMEFA